ncbi:MAG: MurR/RpiR family transcriptional regulator, partial [Sneathiellales bacterium]|nr:MurR/RpiR family transcriptional regulator [Sneathiellales bacterium]
EAEIENIDRTYGSISDSLLEKSAAACVNADRVFVVGLRKCFSVASFFHYATRVFFQNSKLVQGCAGLFREEIEGISGKDLVVAIAFEPYTRETVETTNLAKERGCKVIAITDSSVSPLAKNADFVFLVANRSPSFYRSLSGALSVAQALVAAIVTHLGESAVQALEQSDASLRASNTYWYN